MLYRYIFRGLGIVLVAGMITAFILAVVSQTHAPARHDDAPGRSTEQKKVRP